MSYILPQLGHPPTQVQVLTPTNKNQLGARSLNFNIQQQLNPYNPNKPEITLHGIVYRVGDRVMQILNNYDKDIYNGEMGIITDIKKEENRKRNKNGTLDAAWNVIIQFDRQREQANTKRQKWIKFYLPTL